MSHIVLASLSAELEDRIMQATGGRAQVLRLERLPEAASELIVMIQGAPADVLIIDAVTDQESALRLADQLGSQFPSVAVVLATLDVEGIALPALRAGVRDVISPDADPQQLGEVLQRVAATAAAPQLSAVTPLVPRTGRIISVVSPKGGVGKTTVATNIAVGLAQLAPDATVLVDLDIQFGDVASSLDLEPEYFLADVVSPQALHDGMVLKTFLTRHETGLHVISAPDSPVDADSITAEQVSRLLTVLASEFRYVVVDTAPGLSEHTLSVLDHSTDLVLLTSMEVPGIRGLRKELDTLSDLGLLPASRTVVLNFAEPHGLLGVGDVEAVIGTSVDLQLPRSKAASTAVNQGVPLLQSGVRDPLTKSLARLVELLTPGGAPMEATKIKAVAARSDAAAGRFGQLDRLGQEDEAAPCCPPLGPYPVPDDSVRQTS